MDGSNQHNKKPVSNLSSALASIHLTNQQQQNNNHTQNSKRNDDGNNNNTDSPGSPDADDMDISNSTTNSTGKPSLSTFAKYQNNNNSNNNNHNNNHHHNNYQNDDYRHDYDDLISEPFPSVISAPINLPQTLRQTQQSQLQANSRNAQDPNSQFFTQNANNMDFSMASQAEEPPLDRVGLYIKNPPSEGISLFSHRVCTFWVMLLLFFEFYFILFFRFF